jgi:hypothetical protein
VLNILHDFVDAEDLPPSTHVHLSCAMLSLLREEDEQLASTDILPQPDSEALISRQLRHHVTTSDAMFQQAYCRAVSKPEQLETLAHMENMYAAAMQDLSLAQESTAARHNTWVSKVLQAAATVESETKLLSGSRNGNGNGNVDQERLLESAILVQQYVTEIQQTKVEQRSGFREFVLEQDNIDLIDEEEALHEDVKQQHVLNALDEPTASEHDNKRHTKTLFDQELFRNIVHHGLPALFAKKKKKTQQKERKNTMWSNQGAGDGAEKKGIESGTTASTSTEELAMMLNHRHLATHTTQRLSRFVTCFGQQRKTTVDIELICPSLITDGGIGGIGGIGGGEQRSTTSFIPSMFVYSNDPDLSMLQRQENAQKSCSNDQLHALILPTDCHGRMNTSFVKLCHSATEFCFDDVQVQYEQGKSHQARRSLKVWQEMKESGEGIGGVNEGEKHFEQRRGDSIITKHTNLCGLQLVFHLLRDGNENNDNDFESNILPQEKDESGENEQSGDCGATNNDHATASVKIHHTLNLRRNNNNNKNHHQTVRDVLSKSVRSIVRSSALIGASVLYIPYDLYSPLEAGFGTRDFVKLVRDTRATIMELIASQRQHASKHQLKCVRFVNTSSDDHALTSSLISVLQEQFATDIFHEK